IRLYAADGAVLLPNVIDVNPVPVLTGTVTLDVKWTNNYVDQLPNPASGSVMIQYMLDGDQPVSEYMPGPPFVFSLDTTQIPDGTHILSVRIVDSTGASWPASRLRGPAQQVAVRNGGPLSTGPQKIPVGGFNYG